MQDRSAASARVVSSLWPGAARSDCRSCVSSTGLVDASQSSCLGQPPLHQFLATWPCTKCRQLYIFLEVSAMVNLTAV